MRSYPGHASFAADARRDLREFATASGMEAADIDDITIAVGEVLVFAVENIPSLRRGFLLTARHGKDAISIDISDSAARFGKRIAVRDPQFESLAPRGFGMALIAKLVDEVTLSEGGTRVRMIKRFRAET